jgi:DNA-binding CsgD family transcriptional regulator
LTALAALCARDGRIDLARRLLAAGKRDADIAAILVLSPHTVHRHISHIFAKTGASNRVEAAAYARRRGLVD